jgi:hypothetical protein
MDMLLVEKLDIAHDAQYQLMIKCGLLPGLQVKVVLVDAVVKATVPEMFGMQELPYPLRIGPVSPIVYYEQRQGFNILAWLKTPYGMLLGFMVFTLLIMPLLKVDQEEYRQMQEERRKITPGSSGR